METSITQRPVAVVPHSTGNLLEILAVYLEGKGDLESRLIRGISRDNIWVIGAINLFAKFP